jgi:hypothetical protein
MVATSTRRAYLRTNHQRLRNFRRLHFLLPGPVFPEVRLLQQTIQMIVWCAYPACIFATCIEALLQVCGIKPKLPRSPTCGLTCAAKLKASGGSYPTRGLGSTESPSYLGDSNKSGDSSYSGSSGGSSPMCIVSALSLFVTDSGLSFYIGQVCGVRPRYSNGAKKYPTCGLTCKKKYEASGGSSSTDSSVPTSRLEMCVVSFTRLLYATSISYAKCRLFTGLWY